MADGVFDSVKLQAPGARRAPRLSQQSRNLPADEIRSQTIGMDHFDKSAFRQDPRSDQLFPPGIAAGHDEEPPSQGQDFIYGIVPAHGHHQVGSQDPAFKVPDVVVNENVGLIAEGSDDPVALGLGHERTQENKMLGAAELGAAGDALQICPDQ